LNDIDYTTTFKSVVDDFGDKTDDNVETFRLNFTLPGDSEFTRFWSSTSREPKPRCRWFKVHFVHNPTAKTNWPLVLTTLSEEIAARGFKDVCLGHISTKIAYGFITGSQVAQCCGDAVRNKAISEATGIALSAINKLAILNKTSHPSSLHQIQEQGDLAGANLISGIQHRMRTAKDNNRYVAEKPRTALVFGEKPHTLADVVTRLHPRRAAFLQTRDGISMLNRQFKDVKVIIRSGKNSETRIVTGFREGNPASVPLTLLHYAWSIKDEAFILPDLPCVDVGTSAEPLFLPLELCTVLPEQCLQGPINAALSREAEQCRLKFNKALTLEAPFKTTQGRAVVYSSPSVDSKARADRLNGLVSQACATKYPNILFVEVGSVKVQSSSWDSLQESLRGLIKESIDQHIAHHLTGHNPGKTSTGKSPLLSLRYGSTGTISSDKWTGQLRKFISDHNGAEGQRTFMVVCMPAESNHAKIYKAIKNACDVTAGVQTFFVTRAHLESKACEDPAYGIYDVAAELRRRIRFRNPPMLAVTASIRASSNPKAHYTCHSSFKRTHFCE
jgi:hypothetical protein